MVGQDYSSLDLHEDNLPDFDTAHARGEGMASRLGPLSRFAAFLSPAIPELSRPNHNRDG